MTEETVSLKLTVADINKINLDQLGRAQTQQQAEIERLREEIKQEPKQQDSDA